MQIYLQVQNSSVAVKGTDFQITANLTYNYSGFMLSILNGSVISPELEITLSGPSNITNADAGKTYNFSALIRHTGNSNAPAFMLSFYDYFTNIYTVSSSVSITQLSYDSTNASIDGNGINATILSLNLTDTVRISYTLTVIDNVVPNATLFQENIVFYRSSRSSIFFSYNATSDRWKGSTRLPSFNLSASPMILSVGDILTVLMTINLNDGLNPLVATLSHPFNTSNGLLRILSSTVVRLDNPENSLLSIGSRGEMKDNYGSDGVNESVVFNFGSNMRNLGAKNNSNIAIVQVLLVVVDNSVYNKDGVNLAIDGAMTFASPQTLYGQIYEPKLVISAIVDKSRYFVTPTNIILVDIGDYLEFTITISHNSSSTSNAFYLNFYSTNVAEFRLTSGSVLFQSSNSSLMQIYSGNNAGDSVLNITYVQISLVEQVIITYRYQITSSLLPETKVFQTAFFDYYSSQQIDYARKYSLIPEEIYVARVPTSSIAITETSFVETFYNETFADTTIGEIIKLTTVINISNLEMFLEYRLSIVPNSRSIVPLEILSSIVTLSNSVFNSSILNNTSGAVNSVNDTVIFSFGNTIIDSAFLSKSRASIIITTSLLVRSGVGSLPGDLFSIRDEFNYGTYQKNSSINGRIVGPTLSLSLTPSYSDQVNGGDSLIIRAIINQSSSSSAYNISINDFLSIPQVIFTQSPVLEIYNQDQSLNNSITLAVSSGQILDELRRDQTAIIYYFINVTGLIYPEVNFSSTLVLSYLSSPSSSVTADARVLNSTWMATPIAPNISFFFVSTSLQGAISQTLGSLNANIGEEISVNVVITPINGFLPLTLQIYQQPSTGSVDPLTVVSSFLAFMDVMIVNSSLPLGTNGTLIALSSSQNEIFFSLGNESSNTRYLNYSDSTPQLIVFFLSFRVPNIPQNVNGTSLSIIASLGDGVTSQSISLDVVIIEPLLNAIFLVTKDNNNSGVFYGESYTLSTYIQNVFPSNSNAYSLLIEYSYDSTKLSILNNVISVILSETNTILNFTSFPIAIDYLGFGSNISISFQLLLNLNVFPSEVINLQNFSITYQSANTSSSSFSRMRSILSPSFNVTVNNPIDDLAIVKPSSISQIKSLSFLNATIGEKVSFQWTIQLIRGSNPLFVRIFVPNDGGIYFLNSTLISLGPNVSNSNVAIGDSANFTDSNSDGLIDIVSFDFGILINNEIGNDDPNTVVIEIVWSPSNLTSTIFSPTQNITSIANYSTDSLSSTTIATNTVLITEPFLITELSLSSNYPKRNNVTITRQPNDVVRHVLMVQNIGNAIAYDPFVSYKLNASYSIIEDSVFLTTAIDSVSTPLSFSFVNETEELLFILPQLQPGEIVNISFTTTISFDPSFIFPSNAYRLAIATTVYHSVYQISLKVEYISLSLRRLC